jgi:glycine/D-amino acid oxidase-like deaminating enzyme
MELDHPLHMLDRAETLRLSGSSGYLAALLDPTGGQINPLAYVRGLVGAAQAAGAVVYGHSPVVRYERVSGAWRLFTAHGSVTAENVYFTTNALIGNLIPEVARSQIPVTVYQIATEVLDEADRHVILPERHCLSDLRHQRVAYRWSACNRLLTGGVMAIKAGISKRMPKHYLARLRHVLPGRGPFRAAYAWQGTVGVTRDFMPRLMNLGSGMYAALACNGRGVTMATAFGRVLARFAVDGREADLPVPITRPNPIPLHRFIRHGPSLWLPWSRVQDWCEERLGAR